MRAQRPRQEGSLHNDFSTQEAVMTNSAVPPGFALTATAKGDDSSAEAGRKVIPFEGFGGDLELDGERTTTVLGRSVEGATKAEMMQNVDKPLGTNYFRYQPEFMVGDNKGGGNVLDVADRTWTWPLNNAWLQASLDRGDKIRFISDPTDPSTLYREGDAARGLTVTGMELGVLLNRGHAPDENTGIVQKGYRPASDALWLDWKELGREVESTGKLDELDADAYAHFLTDSQAPARAAKEFKTPEGDIVAVQTNFFGGKPSPREKVQN